MANTITAPTKTTGKPIAKPANLTYGLDETPPLITLLLLSFQHMCIMSIGLVFPVLLIRAIGGSIKDAQCFVGLSMIAGGIGTILQTRPKKSSIGAGYLLPEGPDPSFMAVSLQALQMGGLPLLYGMTIIAGIFESAVAPLISRLRVLFPAEVTGVIVPMVGLSIIPLTMHNWITPPANAPIPGFWYPVVGIVTLAVMVGCSVWGKGRIKTFSALIGMIVGYAAGISLGMLTNDQLKNLEYAPVFALPFMKHWGLSFNAALLLPFLIAITTSFLKNIGDITTCQRINDANWTRLDMQSVKRGIMADGMSTTLGGLFGGMGQASYSANVGLSVATGATSRRIGLYAGTLFIILAFFPRLTAFFANMPGPVIGASLIFCVCFMVVAGFQIIMSRMIDSRKTFVIGLSFIFGLSAMVPNLYDGMPELLKPIFSNSLSLATVSVIILNLIFRIGIAKRVSTRILPGEDTYEQIRIFMETCGGNWGARRDVIQRSITLLQEVMDSITTHRLSSGPVQIDVMFDEFNLNLDISYEGMLLEFPEERPYPKEIAEDNIALAKLSGFLIRRLADHIQSDCNETRCHIQVHFIH
jgi:NCS2 family nucleobase:cation symporter-2